MTEQKYLWYASYGSNLSIERFLCYVKGGIPEGSHFNYKGCDDKSDPLAIESIQIPHQMYFAKSSVTWNGGGVCFLNHLESLKYNTLGRMYLITVEQFLDVVKQENGGYNRPSIDFTKAVDQKKYTFENSTWYGTLLYLGEQNGYPIFTFTHSYDITDYRQPSPAYLHTIIRGVREAYNKTDSEIADYLLEREGVFGYLGKEEIISIINQV